MLRYDGEVRVTDRATGASVRVSCVAMLANADNDGESVIALELHTNASEVPINVECDSVAEMRAVLRAFDAILAFLPAERPADFSVLEKNRRGPEPCDFFGGSIVCDDDAE